MSSSFVPKNNVNDGLYELIQDEVIAEIASGGGSVPDDIDVNSIAINEVSLKSGSFSGKIATGTLSANRTYTFPNQSGGVVLLTPVQTLTNKDLTSATNTFPSSLVTLTGVETLTNKTLNNPSFGLNTLLNASGNIITIPTAGQNDTLLGRISTDNVQNKSLFDSNNFIVNNSDNTKRLQFSLAGSTTGTTTTLISNAASNINLTLPTTTGFLLNSAVNFPTVSSNGISLDDNYTMTNIARINGLSLRSGSNTITDSASAASAVNANISDVFIGQKTVNATNTAVTYTNAASLRIFGQPLPGTNATITSGNAMLIDNGNIALLNGRVRSTSLANAAAPAFALGTLLNDGIFSSGAGNVNIATAGTLRATFANSGLTLAANYSLSTSGTATMTSGSGGFTSAGPLSSSLASSAAACSVRPSNNANTGIFGTAATNVSISVGGTAIVSCATTGATITGTLAASGVSNLNGGAKVGTNGSIVTQKLFGSFTLTAPNIANNANRDQTVTFSTAFSSTPVVFATISPAAGSSWFDQLYISVNTVGTSSCSIRLRNIAGAATTGDCVVYWFAMN